MAAGVPSGLIAGWAVPVPGFPGAMHPDTKLSDSSVHCGCILTAWGPSFQACLRRPAGWRLAALAALAPAAAPGPGPSPRAPSRNVSDRAGTSSFSGGDDGLSFPRGDVPTQAPLRNPASWSQLGQGPPESWVLHATAGSIGLLPRDELTCCPQAVLSCGGVRRPVALGGCHGGAGVRPPSQVGGGMRCLLSSPQGRVKGQDVAYGGCEDRGWRCRPRVAIGADGDKVRGRRSQRVENSVVRVGQHEPPDLGSVQGLGQPGSLPARGGTKPPARSCSCSRGRWSASVQPRKRRSTSPVGGRTVRHPGTVRKVHWGQRGHCVRAVSDRVETVRGQDGFEKGQCGAV